MLRCLLPPHDFLALQNITAKGPTSTEAINSIFHGLIQRFLRAKQATATKLITHIESMTASTTTESRVNADGATGAQEDSPLDDTNSGGHLTGLAEPATQRGSRHRRGGLERGRVEVF